MKAITRISWYFLAPLPFLFSLPLLRFLLTFPEVHGLSNPAKGFRGALLAPPVSGGERHFQPPDTFPGLSVHQSAKPRQMNVHAAYSIPNKY